MSSQPKTIFINNDTLAKLTGLQNPVDSAFLNTATVSVTIKDLSGSEVDGVTWPITLAYVAASNGDYEGIIDKAVVLVEGNRYFLEFTASLSGIDGFWRVPVEAAFRAE